MGRVSSYKKGWLAVLAILGSAHFVQAEGPTISGFIDTTYNYNFNKPRSRRTAYRSFDNVTDAFALNATQINIEGSKEGVGYMAKLSYGTDASVYKSRGAGSDSAGVTSNNAYNFELQEAYLTYKCPVTSIMLKAGKFATLEGIEVIESKDNATISRGFLFGLAEPFTHVGALAGYAFPKYVEIWVGAANGWDVYTDNNKSKTLLGKIGITPCDKISGSISASYGSERDEASLPDATGGVRPTTLSPHSSDRLTSIDTTWTIKPVSMLNLAFQANYGEQENSNGSDRNSNGIIDGGVGHWYGLGFQPTVKINDKYSVGARYEWFSNLDGARAGADNNSLGTPQILQNVTIAPAVNLTSALMFRVEYRYDWSSRNNVYEVDNAALANNAASTVSTEFVYKF